MINKFEFSGTVNADGQICFSSPVVYRTLARRFTDQEVQVTIAKVDKTRSARQNRYYWGVVVPLAMRFYKDCTGEPISQAEMHAYHLTEILGFSISTKTVYDKEVFMVEAKGTSEMTTVEFNEFKEKLQQHYSEKGLDIPDPTGDNFLNDFL